MAKLKTKKFGRHKDKYFMVHMVYLAEVDEVKSGLLLLLLCVSLGKPFSMLLSSRSRPLFCDWSGTIWTAGLAGETWPLRKNAKKVPILD